MVQATVRLPAPWKGGQDKFVHWHREDPVAQVLVAPCGTKVGKSFASAIWLASEGLLNPKMFMVWVAPTYAKCKIGYRYLKAMLDIDGIADCVDGLLEIRLANGSFIKFLHGRDAEVTIEGEAVDRFILDEAAKINPQVWFSLLTTITQTGGLGIITGTPRGFNWYYDLYRKAKGGDPMFAHVTLMTYQSPFNKPAQIERAQRILPKHLYQQYYRATFVSSGSVFGDISKIWDESIKVPDGNLKFWVHPDPTTRSGEIVHGVDIAKKHDYTVFYSINTQGQHVGYCRFNKSPYPMQAQRMEMYLQKYFSHSADNIVRFDETGVGTALGDLFNELEIDASFTPVTFTNKSKQEMVTRLTLAVEQGWLSGPRIEVFEHELSSYEVKVTRTGLHSYNAAEGEHDDTVCAAMLAVGYAYQSSVTDQAEKYLEEMINGKSSKYDSDILEVASAFTGEEDDFFATDTDDQTDDDFTFEGTYG